MKSLIPLACAVLFVASTATVCAGEKLDVPVRGQSLVLVVYRPPAAPRGTIVMGSGDVGWVGLAASMAEDLSARGYLVVGLNVRQYLSAFTSGKSHLEIQEEPSDYRTIADALKRNGMLVHPVILSGVSEGAALAALAASDAKNHAWIDGVITMGIPPSAELAWRWTDAGAWITKRDADEPSFAPKDVIGSVAPVPLFMIQSRKDEYVPQAEYERLFAAAREPKQLVLIDASNHRFTDRREELRTAYAAGLEWIAQHAAKGRQP